MQVLVKVVVKKGPKHLSYIPDHLFFPRGKLLVCLKYQLTYIPCCTLSFLTYMYLYIYVYVYPYIRECPRVSVDCMSHGHVYRLNIY